MSNNSVSNVCSQCGIKQTRKNTDYDFNQPQTYCRKCKQELRSIFNPPHPFRQNKEYSSK